jgi:hypothetical protein
MDRFKEIKAIAVEFNFTLHREGKHYIWKSPSGALVTTGKTLSDRKALKNIRSMFRRASVANCKRPWHKGG